MWSKFTKKCEINVSERPKSAASYRSNCTIAIDTSAVFTNDEK